MFINIPGSGSGSWKGSVATSADLPTTGNLPGDARTAQDTGIVYVWDGGAWIAQSGGAISGPFNQLVYFDGTGNLTNLPGFSRDTFSGGLDQFQIETPNNGTGYTLNNLNVEFQPLQNSPNENWNIQSIQVNLDPTSTGFNMGSAGNNFSQILNLGFFHHGTGNAGALTYLSLNGDLGNGTDPITINGLYFAAASANIHSGVTIDGQIQGYGFNPAMQVGSISGTNQNLQAFWDGSQILVPENTHTSFASQPNIQSIKNNANYNAFTAGPNITTLTGNATATGFGFYGQITNTNTGGINSFYSNPSITTMGATSYYHGLDIYGNITTSHGNVQGINIQPNINGGDANFQALNINPGGGATLPQVNGIHVDLSGLNSTAQKIGLDLNDGKLNVTSNYHTDILSASPGFVNLIGLSTEYWVKPGFPVTNTLVLANATQENAIFEDDMGPDAFGGFLGYAAHPSFTQSTVAVGKTVSAFNQMPIGVSIPDVSGFGITDGGTYTVATIVNNLGFIPGGGTVAIDTLYGYRTSSAFGTFATNAWNLYDESSTENYLNKLAIGVASKKVSNSDVSLDLSTAKAFMLGQATTVQKLAFTALAGMVVYDTTLNQLSYYNGSTWINL